MEDKGTATTAAPIPLRAVSQRPEQKSLVRRPLMVQPVPTGMDRPLNMRQRKFVEYYLQTGNANEAARRAGYSAHIARDAAHIIKDNPRIQKAINSRLRKKFAQLEVNSDRILQETAAAAFANIQDYIDIDENGDIKFDLTKVDRFQAAAIQDIYYDAMGKLRIRLMDKKSALELMARYYKMLSERSDPLNGDGKGALTVGYLDKIIQQHITVNNYNVPAGHQTLEGTVVDPR